MDFLLPAIEVVAASMSTALAGVIDARHQLETGLCPTSLGPLLPLLGMALVPRKRRRSPRPPKQEFGTVQEAAGFHLGIGKSLTAAGDAAADFFRARYQVWLERGWAGVETRFKCQHFTVAVGGGNTVKAQYRALLKHHLDDIDWLQHVRFFFLEECCGEVSWESAQLALGSTFLEPLAARLIAQHGRSDIASRLQLPADSDAAEITRAVISTMTVPLQMEPLQRAFDSGDRKLALQLANQEATRYRKLLQEHLGERMSLHMIVSGIARDGGIGAFTPYQPALKRKKPGIAVLEQESGAIRIALNRGILTGAERVSLIISGNLKLNVLGRFEMEDYAAFEQTVMETPLRLLRETPAIANKVYVFADAEALHFAEGTVRFTEHGRSYTVRSEVREGLEADGIHILLLHGFMGLYSYVNLIIKLPSAWQVSALHRGSDAKKLPEKEIFPHYALCLRKALLDNWRQGCPTPIGCHSMGGVISDHLLLSTVGHAMQPLPEFEQLAPEDQAIIEALRVAGIIHLAAWAPTDVVHLLTTVGNLTRHLRRREPLDYSGPQDLYNLNLHGGLQFNERHRQTMIDRPRFVEKLLRLPATELVVNGLNGSIRSILAKKDLQQMLSRHEVPYGLRVIGERMLKKISFYGLLKEINAAIHDPYVYIERHLKALEVIIKYDIPFLSIVHEDDFIVSASRHRQEHEYLLGRRLAKEGVSREEDLQVPARLLVLQRDQEILPVDPLNPHLMVMSTNREGSRITREVTAAMTRFVNENVGRAIDAGKVRPLTSVARWRRQQRARS